MAATGSAMTDGLGVEELAHAGGGEFAPVAGVLDAAEGQARIAGDHGVEEDGASTGGRRRSGRCSAGSLVQRWRRVRRACRWRGDGFVDIADTEEQSDGAEDLFVVDGRGEREAGEDGGLVVVAGASRRSPPVSKRAPACDRGLDLGVEFVDWSSVGERADVGVVAGGVADLLRVHGGDEAGFEVGVNGVGDEEALGGDAGLAVVDAAGAERRF